MENLEVSQPAPLVSIAIPLYNGKRFIRGCLDNLAAQTFKDYELVIVDNGSNDGTSEICREYAAKDSRIRYIRFDETIPIAQNFWRSFQLTRGKYFTWNSADDRRDPEVLAQAVAVYEKYPDTVAVDGPVELDVVNDGTLVMIPNDFDASMADPAARVAAFTRGVQHNGNYFALFRRDALSRVVLRQKVGHDYLVCLQMAMIGPVRRIQKPIIRYWHVWGPMDNPMYGYRAISIPGLLAWPKKSFKCWTTLGRGVGYLLREHGTPLVARVRSAVAFAATFSARFGWYLVSEASYVLAAPVAVALWPLTQAARGAFGRSAQASKSAGH